MSWMLPFGQGFSLGGIPLVSFTYGLEWHHPDESLRAAPEYAYLQSLSKRISLQS
nr:hypothetical protein VCHA53O474_200093 [Vibrio chagasii]